MRIRDACAASLLALCLGACVTPPAPPEPADLVLRNGRLVTMDRERPEAQALAARGGRIVAVGTDAEVARFTGANTRTIDLQGRLTVPGFIEAHGHFVGLGETKHQDKWSSPPQPNVDGFPTHASLDAVSPDNPVVLTHASGHGVFVNARALALSAITRATRNPPGGEILKDAGGEPVGFLSENAEDLVQRGAGEPAPTAEEAAARRREALRLADREAIGKGVTRSI